ncbi:MAG TPA: hypothetical protein ENG45_00380, partial [Candidatus Aenigmarchaeota archaeon]|nr:hypothetical protein [Candidatus Aenigmarchaeota archaeon]
MKKRYIILIIIFLTFLSIFHKQNNYVEDNVSLTVYFCPRDRCEKVILNYFYGANESILCAFYKLDIKEIIKALNRSGLNVKLILDKNSPWIPIYAKRNLGNQLMHNKFCVIDERIVITGSFNPNKDSLHDINDLVVIHSKKVSKNYIKEFEEMWNGYFGFGSKTEHPSIKSNDITLETYFCPEDDCVEHVIKTLMKAKNSVYFSTFILTEPRIAEMLINLKNRGIKVIGIFERSTKSKFSKFELLKKNGLNVKTDNYKYYIHTKFFIIDNETVITGS